MSNGNGNYWGPPGGNQYPPQAPPPGYWAYVPMQTKPPTSGLRVAAGIVSIVLGPWSFLSFFVMITAYSGIRVSYGLVAFFLLVSAVAHIVSGIVLLAKHRSRNKGAPMTLIIFTAISFLSYFTQLASGFMGPALGIWGLLTCTAILILTFMAMVKERSPV